MISLTEQGVALAAQMVPEREELVAECMGVIAPEDQSVLHQLLNRLDRVLGPQ